MTACIVNGCGRTAAHEIGECARVEVGGGGMAAVLAEVADERGRQDAKWGQRDHPNGTGDDWAFCSGQHSGWAEEAADDARRRCQEAPTKPWGDTYALILNEEVAEAFAEDDPDALRRELIQVAAVAVAWVEKIDRDAGCDCTELCSMGPTCPGGMLAGLPDAGCWRTDTAATQREQIAQDVEALRPASFESAAWRNGYARAREEAAEVVRGAGA